MFAALWGWQASIPPEPFERLFSAQADVASSQRAAKGELPPAADEIQLDGGQNFRDLGGYISMDGRPVAWGRVYRSGEMNRLTQTDLDRLGALGIRVVCDLRTPGEASYRPTRLPVGAIYYRLPIFVKDPIGRFTVLFGRHRLNRAMKTFYQDTLVERGAAKFGNVLKLVANPENLPLVIHCTSGKDRTGIAAALLLHICGVPRKTIVADYTLTNLSVDSLLASMRKAFADQRMPPGLRLEQLYPLFSARAELLDDALAYIENRYGSVDAYLSGPVGMSAAEIHQIRENMLSNF